MREPNEPVERNSQNSALSFSRHVLIRKQQRDIDDDSIHATLKCGEQEIYGDSAICVDDKLKIVLSNNCNTIITVGKNTRNTRFDLSERTRAKAKSLLFQAKIRNNDHAMCELAELYLNGDIGERNVKEAYKLYEKAAQMGNSHAMCKISEIYSCGYLGTPNEKLAIMWMEKAADYQNRFALAVTGQRLLASFLERYPVKSNIFRPSAPKKEILDYLNRAANKGATRAIWQLGNIYEEGLLGEKDLSKAIEFYVKAAKCASPSSLDSLQSLAGVGEFSATELENILDDLSVRLASTSIAMALQLGTDQLLLQLGYNRVRGLKLVEDAAIKKFDDAMMTLANCYKYGVSCDENLKLAQYWYTKVAEWYNVSAKEGNVKSLWRLGELHLNGDIGTIDLEKAELCFREAIEKSSNPFWYDVYTWTVR